MMKPWSRELCMVDGGFQFCDLWVHIVRHSLSVIL